MTQIRLYSTQTRKNRVGFVSCSRVVSNFASPKREMGKIKEQFSLMEDMSICLDKTPLKGEQFQRVKDKQSIINNEQSI